MKLVRRLLFTLFLIFIFRVYFGSYDSFLSDFVRNQLIENKVPCQFASINVVPFLKLRASELTCSIPSSKVEGEPTDVSFHSVEVSLSWSDLFALRPGIALTANPLKEGTGKASIILARSISSGKSKAALKLKKYPVGSILKTGLIPGLSIDGELNGDLEFNFSDRNDLIGQGMILFENGSLSASGMERSLIKLPAIRQLSLSLPIKSTKDSVNFSPISIASTFGVLKGEASVKELPQSAKYTFNGTLLLNELGLKTIGGYVAVMAGTDVNNPTEEWKIVMTGDAGQKPSIKITPEE